MICTLFKAIEIMELAEERMRFAIISNYHSDAVRAFCQAYTNRFRMLAVSDPKHRDLYLSSVQFLVNLRHTIGVCRAIHLSRQW